jgi:hypothetical protein
MTLLMPIVAALVSAAPAAVPAADAQPESPFAQRGYYMTFMRMPTWDLADWRKIVDDIHDDGGNMLLLWTAGAFRSKKFPITWAYNEEHENIKSDFVRKLIDYAHSRGIKVLLSFTPFGYDGVNQYPLEHPELKAIGKNGQPTGKFGIGCWGYNLCPSRPESQQFMLDYVREMAFDFYPNADGMMIESSDYAICHCPDCGARFFDKEFQFVRTISEEYWAKKPDATIVVYPHYFSGAEVPGFGVRAAKQPFDPRWGLFFTPHSAHLDAALIKQARISIFWDEAPALHRPPEIQKAAQEAKQAGVTGFVPSLEQYSFVSSEADDGQQWLKGKRQVPMGFGWLKIGESPYDELPMRVNRIAYREFSRDPDLPYARYKEDLGREIFGASATPQAVDDLLELQAAFAAERRWTQASPLVTPERVRALVERGTLTPEKQASYRAAVERLRSIAERHRDAQSSGERELRRIAQWVVDQWAGENAKLLAPAR